MAACGNLSLWKSDLNSGYCFSPYTEESSDAHLLVFHQLASSSPHRLPRFESMKKEVKRTAPQELAHERVVDWRNPFCLLQVLGWLSADCCFSLLKGTCSSTDWPVTLTFAAPSLSSTPRGPHHISKTTVQDIGAQSKAFLFIEFLPGRKQLPGSRGWPCPLPAVGWTGKHQDNFFSRTLGVLNHQKSWPRSPRKAKTLRSTAIYIKARHYIIWGV